GGHRLVIDLVEIDGDEHLAVVCLVARQAYSLDQGSSGFRRTAQSLAKLGVSKHFGCHCVPLPLPWAPAGDRAAATLPCEGLIFSQWARFVPAAAPSSADRSR